MQLIDYREVSIIDTELWEYRGLRGDVFLPRGGTRHSNLIAIREVVTSELYYKL
jgi:hypothetical protein